MSENEKKLSEELRELHERVKGASERLWKERQALMEGNENHRLKIHEMLMKIVADTWNYEVGESPLGPYDFDEIEITFKKWRDAGNYDKSNYVRETVTEYQIIFDQPKETW